MKRHHRLRLTLALVVFSIACAHTPPPTPVAAVADIGTRLELSAGALLDTSTALTTTIDPLTNKPFLSRAQLDVVALAVNKFGHLGLDLRTALDNYKQLKASGGNAAAQVAAVQAIIGTISQGMTDIGKSIPSGTIAEFDKAAASVIGIVAEAKAAIALPS